MICLVDEVVLKCVFWDDVLCSFSKDEKFRVMARCSKCPHYLRFIRSMDEEEEENARFVEGVRKHPEAYSRGELR